MYNERNFIKKVLKKLKALKKKAKERGVSNATWKAFKRRCISKLQKIIIRKRREG